jgi:hypothetical protein
VYPDFYLILKEFIEKVEASAEKLVVFVDNGIEDKIEKYKADLIAVEAGETIIVDADKMIEFANPCHEVFLINHIDGQTVVAIDIPKIHAVFIRPPRSPYHLREFSI